MAKFTKEIRQTIIEDFARRHNGHYDPAGFFEEVKAAGSTHPAWAWFEWDTDVAAREHNLWQARMFAQGLVIKFTIEEITPSGVVKIRQAAPALLSPLETRPQGGGYFMTDMSNPQHMAELCHQAATSLRSWLLRYGSCLQHVGQSPAALEHIVDELAAVDVKGDEAA